MANEIDKRHDREIDRLIAAGLIALRKAFGALFLLRLLQLTFRQPILNEDRQRVIAILQSELSERTAIDGSIYRVIAESIRKAGPDVVNYELTVADEYGLILSSRLDRAQEQLIHQIDRSMTEAVLQEESRSDVSTTVFGILSQHSAFKRVMAYDTARAYNLQLLARLLESNAEFLRIRLSDEHTVTDICDQLVGVFLVSEITGPPYRRLPPFHPFCNCYVTPFK